MADFLKVPKYIDDAPREYTSFTGGINNDLDNENIYDHELRDAINVHYRNGNLERRFGATVLKTLRYLDYHPDEHRDLIQGSFVLPTKNNTYIVIVRDGFIYYSRFKKGAEELNLVQVNISIDDMIDKTDYDPMNVIIGLHKYTHETRPKFNSVHDGFIYETAPKEFEDKPFGQGEGIIPYPSIKLPVKNILVLQNYKKVEGALFDRKLYLATGTRYLIIEEEVIGNEEFLKCSIVSPKTINGFEYQNIGTNLLSPFPNQLMSSTHEVATSNLANLLIQEQYLFEDDKVINVEAIMNFKRGKLLDDYYFRWEIKKPGNEWETILYFRSGLGQQNESINFSGQELVVGEEFQIRCTYTDLFMTKMEEKKTKDTMVSSTTLTRVEG